MGLFGNKQEYLNHHRVPSETEKAIRRLEGQWNDLEKKIESLTWRANVITAEEAAERFRQIENKALPKELNKAFVAIDEAINNEQDSLILFEYTRENNGYTAFDFPRYEMVRVYHIESLAEALRKYGYRVDIYDPEDDYGLRLKICLRGEGNKLMSSKIDPDKKYILPMKGTDWIDKGVRYYATIHKNYWEPLKWTGGVLPPYGPLYEVQGRDIIDAPDWVKAIKPIEVKE
ncbi:hypothetical protein [Limosilactobacillus caviae]|uniref:hypothetical protein n=1 Tax=Limosilactobacillus caviae TaxID=1769424 RepID=UPI001E327100|nr:hypothetical protein [Limosilactobacillus caviae]MCD7123311.1 hypothetical protein [Limosilactobacillus caviae]